MRKTKRYGLGAVINEERQMWNFNQHYFETIGTKNKITVNQFKLSIAELEDFDDESNKENKEYLLQAKRNVRVPYYS